jgi:hypothetical protein
MQTDPKPPYSCRFFHKSLFHGQGSDCEIRTYAEESEKPTPKSPKPPHRFPRASEAAPRP